MQLHSNVAQRYEQRCEGESVVVTPRKLRAQILDREDEGNERYGFREDVKSKQEKRIGKNRGTFDAMRVLKVERFLLRMPVTSRRVPFISVDDKMKTLKLQC